ncbi:hypothetical protein ACHAXR_003854 [Thalassiosira sp. AJA248-18]
MAKSSGGFTGGKLNLKGDKKKKKKSKKSKHRLGESSELDVAAKSQEEPHKDESVDDKKEHHGSSDDESLTAAEKRARKFKQQRERVEMEQVGSMSHRERVEQFNEKLGQLTEHNDIPRVSAAGNG